MHEINQQHLSLKIVYQNMRKKERYESFIILALIIKNNFPKYAE